MIFGKAINERSTHSAEKPNLAPAMVAVASGHLECFEVLKDAGITLSATTHGQTLLPANHAHPAMLRCLLALPEAADFSQQPLMHALSDELRHSSVVIGL
eukprot:m.663663 g.663663  ORF g.663663 m.663663 type:complete len:100 (+) comp58486_c0_seq53:164-463(+)